MVNEFKAKDIVYCPLIGSDIYELEQSTCEEKVLIPVDAEDGEFMSFDKYGQYFDGGAVCLYKATKENHALLNKIFPSMGFKRPHLILSGSELAKHILSSESVGFFAYVSDISDESAKEMMNIQFVKDYRSDTKQFECDRCEKTYSYAVPIVGAHDHIEVRKMGVYCEAN